MIEKVRAFIQKHHMITPGDVVIAGVSGGADSICLFLMLEKLRKEISFTLCVVHVNHGIRTEAKDDALYVADICKQYNVEYRCFEKDVPAYAAENHLTEEEAGRKIRYAVFSEVAQEYEKTIQPEINAVKIAVAHHMNDCAETVLFNLFRGTGLAGLGGIKPVRDQIIRPLLCVGRKEIEQYLQNEGVSYCNDHTNLDDTYTRNKLRHHIIEYAEEEICNHASDHIAETAVMVQEAEQYLQGKTEEAYKRCCKADEGRIEIAVSAFQKEDAFIQKRILLYAAEKTTQNRKDLTALHFKAMLSLFERESNGKANLPYQLEARREYDKVILEKRRNEKTERIQNQVVTIPGMISLPEGNTLKFSIFKAQEGQIIPKKPYTKWFDYDKIKKSVMVRTRETGDFFVINKTGNKKTVKSYMIEEKIPASVRDRIPLIAEDHHIIWAVGYRISEAYKVDQSTVNILQIQAVGGFYDE